MSRVSMRFAYVRGIFEVSNAFWQQLGDKKTSETIASLPASYSSMA